MGELEKAKNDLKSVEKNLAVANADIKNLKLKINGLENVDIKKLKSKLAEIRKDLILHDGKLDSQWIQYLTTQDRLKQELKTKSEEVEKMKQVLAELEDKGELTEHGWETVKPNKGEIRAFSQMREQKFSQMKEASPATNQDNAPEE